MRQEPKRSCDEHNHIVLGNMLLLLSSYGGPYVLQLAGGTPCKLTVQGGQQYGA